jgi:hypothetical protein
MFPPVAQRTAQLESVSVNGQFTTVIDSLPTVPDSEEQVTETPPPNETENKVGGGEQDAEVEVLGVEDVAIANDVHGRQDGGEPEGWTKDDDKGEKKDGGEESNDDDKLDNEKEKRVQDKHNKDGGDKGKEDKDGGDKGGEDKKDKDWGGKTSVGDNRSRPAGDDGSREQVPQRSNACGTVVEDPPTGSDRAAKAREAALVKRHKKQRLVDAQRDRLKAIKISKDPTPHEVHSIDWTKD